MGNPRARVVIFFYRYGKVYLYVFRYNTLETWTEPKRVVKTIPQNFLKIEDKISES